MDRDQTCPEWRIFTPYPVANGEWEIYCRGRVIRASESTVEKLVRKWYPLSSHLVATPESVRFLPPICIDGVGVQTHRQYALKYRLLISLAALYLLFVLLVFSATAGLSGAAKPVIFLLLVLTYFVVDYAISVRSKERLVDRTLYFQWLFTHQNRPLRYLVCFLITVGLIQVAVVNQLDGIDELVIRYGIYYNEMNAGSWWRYVIGPFWHGGMLHWLVNVTMLSAVIGIAGPRLSAVSIAIFVATLLLSVTAVQFLSFGDRADGLLGISGGVFGVLGWLVGATYRNRDRLPEYLWLNLFMLALLVLFLPHLMSDSVSFVAHVAGLMSGFFISIVWVRDSVRLITL